MQIRIEFSHFSDVFETEKNCKLIRRLFRMLIDQFFSLEFYNCRLQLNEFDFFRKASIIKTFVMQNVRGTIETSGSRLVRL